MENIQKKNISDLHLKIYRFLMEFQNNCAKDALNCSLITIVKRYLNNLDEEAWSNKTDEFGVSLIDCYYEQGVLTYTLSEKLILFVMFAEWFDKIDEDFLEISSFIAEAFDIERVNPNNYGLYLSLFLDKDICDQLKEIDTEDYIYILTSLISMISLEELRNHNYISILKFLCEYNGNKFSPIFKGDYSIRNVYLRLRNILEDENNSLVFKSRDRETLNLLIDIEEMATDNFRNYFTVIVEGLEKKLEYNRVKIATMIIKSLPIYLSQLSNGFEVISNKDRALKL